MLNKIDGWDQLEFLSRSEIVTRNKKNLLQMAKDGEPRPIFNKHPLGVAFFNYTTKSRLYDSKFVAELKSINSDWLLTRSDVLNQKKQIILQMARDGKPRPNDELKYVLSRCTNANNQYYDEKISFEIKRLSPDWFVSRSEVANQKKNTILQMARDGKPRPTGKLAVALCNYLKNHDDEFVSELRSISPDWGPDFVKQNIISMAKKGDKKPKKGHPYYVKLINYTNPDNSSYDETFTFELKKANQEWVLRQDDISSQKKLQLLQMAENGEPRPNKKTHPLGTALGTYTNKSQVGFDPAFNKQIRKLAPQWFISRSEIANGKKQQLLEMARSGQPRPHYYNHPLGKVLCEYTSPLKSSHDKQFTKKIRQLRPDWFKAC